VRCHIGPGAEWFVKAVPALALRHGVQQMPRPVRRRSKPPARAETCEQCHWPEKFVGNLDRTYNYFLGDETNTPFTVRLTMKVGGGDPTHGPEGGIHWHMNVKNNKVEYVAAKREVACGSQTRIVRQSWFRMIDLRGHDGIPLGGIHQRPKQLGSHHGPWTATIGRPMYKSPNKAVNLAMSLPDQIDRSLPWIKTMPCMR
jgi:hypothetical protein